MAGGPSNGWLHKIFGKKKSKDGAKERRGMAGEKKGGILGKMKESKKSGNPHY